MIKKGYIFILILFPTLLSAQHGNEWIDYDQTYYKFPITETGVYRLTYNDLNNAGFPVSSVDPRNIQIFGHENEVTLYAIGESDGTFDPSDYFEFYAEKPDGRMDSLIFQNPSDHVNKFYNYFGDTVNYFITWNTSIANKRYTVSNSSDYLSYSPKPYVFAKTIYAPATNYRHGVFITASGGNNLSDPRYVAGEGYFSGFISKGQTISTNIGITNPYLSATGPSARVYSASSSQLINENGGTRLNHINISHSTSLGSYKTVYDQINNGIQTDKFTFSILNTDLFAGNMVFKYSLIDDTGAEQDNYSFSEIELNYPHNTDFEGKNYFEFNFTNDEPELRIRTDITNVTGTQIRVMDVSEGGELIFPSLVSGIHHFIFPNFPGKESNFVLYSDESLNSISIISLATSTGKFENYLNNTNDNNLIIISHVKLWSEAIDYKNYRESLAGQGYNVTLADIDQLYNQFGGGVIFSPLSVRRFLKATIDLWTELPKGVLTIGKGVNLGVHIKKNKWGIRRTQSARDKCLIPVLGEPATDNMFTIGLNGDWTKQDIPIGRYSAKTPLDVTLYLDKVKEYESQQLLSNFTLEEKLWQKNVFHFIGGSSEDEQINFLNITRWGKNIIEKPFYGANVEEFLKESSSAINPSDLASIKSKIQNGISIIQLYGHSGYSLGFDANLDEPRNWNNSGKYPIVIANGCNSGDLYQNNDIASNSEDYVIIKDEGAIAYVSTTASGYTNPLGLLTQEFYREVSLLNYGGTLGESQSRALSTELSEHDYMSAGIREKYLGSFIPTTIHGDPMLKMNVYQKPEFIIPADGISFSPANPTLQDTEVEVSVNVYNIGKSVNELVKIELKRTFPNGQDSIYVKDIAGNKSLSRVTFNIPIDHSIAGGLNSFIASVDIPSFVEELVDESINNVSQRNLIIFSDGIVPVLPHEFAIVPEKENTSLIVSTYNPDEPEASYLIEIDTTDTYDSDKKLYQEIKTSGGSFKLDNTNWISPLTSSKEALILEDSVVYFWRAAKKDIYNWKESSFQYIKNKTGWGQSHFFQFKNDDFNLIDYNRTNRKFNYNSDAKVFLSAEMYSNADVSSERVGTKFSIFSSTQDYLGGGQSSPAIMVAVIDPNNLSVWGTPKIVDGVLQNPDHFFGQFNEYGSTGRGRPDKYFVYQQSDPAQLTALENLLTGNTVPAIPDGHFILVYTFVKADYANWNPSLYTVFQGLGADQIVTGQQDNMFAFLAKKGDSSITSQYYSSPIGTSHDLHVFDTEFIANSIGTIDAPKAGPTNRWDAIYWAQDALEPSSGDSSRLFIYGDNGLGVETLLIDTLMYTKDSIKDLYTLIDAELFPYLRLRSTLLDNVTNTPAQINRWQILYDPVPEASVEPSLGLYYSAKNNEVQEGEDVEFAVAFKNISEIDMDSIMIKYWLEDQDHNNYILKYEKLDSLRVGETIMDTVYFNSLGYGGDNTIWLEINTISSETGMPEQLEQYHFNNFYQKRLIVNVDEENPLVDVTFDGAHIFDGDIVSPSPNIIIKFKDENLILKMNESTDTSLFQISMVYPDEIYEEQIYFKNGKGETIMQWYPASGNDNEFTIEYHPENLPDGIYTLKVQGTDKSNNLSGDLSYDVEFEVVNESSITHFYNYPNPFSTKTQFVFTLTGSQVPDDIYIQIMTITGKVVKQITEDELGTIRIGKNVTDYYWNGTDDFGDALANGVYLYRVVTKINGEKIKHRETSKDNLFKNNYGKLYIMR